MNVRHISQFCEFLLSAVPSAIPGSLYDIQVWKNLNSILLNKSKNYKIENLSIDIGCTEYDQIDISFDGLAFPLRFFLDNDPLNSEYDRLAVNFQFSVYYNNQLVVSPNTLGLPQSQDICDSSNSYYNGGILYNFFKTISITNNTGIALQTRKTNTISEYNFFNITQSKIIDSSTNYFSTIITNNDNNNFYFDSKNFELLNFSIYPLFRFLTSNPSIINFLIKFNYTVNFDLVEF